MGDKKILIVEDSKSTAEIIIKLLKDEEYEIKIACNGEEALGLFKNDFFQIVITDLEMPVMDGRELITQLNKMPLAPLIFVETIHKKPDIIIDIMKRGVYDYITKPFESNDLKIKIKRAFDTFEMKRAIDIMKKEKYIRLQNELNYYKQYNNANLFDMKNVNKKLFINLKESLGQGYGYGTLLFAVKLVLSKSKQENDNYIIHSKFIDLLKENVVIADKTFETFEYINRIISRDLGLKQMSFNEFYNFLKKIIDNSKDMANIKNQNVIINEMELDNKIELKISKSDFSIAFQELLINAYKYSERDSSILVIIERGEQYLILKIVNTPIEDTEGRLGISMEYENLVFEPFFRLTKILQEDYKTLDFGLGLTIVDNIITKHMGQISVSNVKDYMKESNNKMKQVVFKILLPYTG